MPKALKAALNGEGIIPDAAYANALDTMTQHQL